jgi:hypothetical protein
MSKEYNTDKLRTTKLYYNDPKSFSFNQDDLWLNEILGELVDELQGELTPDLDCRISLELQAHKHQHYSYRDVVLVKGELLVRYPALSGQTGEQLQQELLVPVSCAFIDGTFQDNEELQEEITLFIENQEWDLYFHFNGVVDLKPVIHEYIFLNRNPYLGSD